VVDAGNRLKRLSEDLFQVMQHDLGEDHDIRRRELDQAQASMMAEKGRIDKEVGLLDGRIAKLDEAASTLESGLDKRLGQMASNTLGEVRRQLEAAVDEILLELETRSSRDLAVRVESGCSQLKAIQSDIETSTLRSLKAQVDQTLRAFAQTLQELQGESVERLRTTLAGGLNSVVKSLGEQFCKDAEPAERRWPAAD
jgi:hypothetical protein